MPSHDRILPGLLDRLTADPSQDVMGHSAAALRKYQESVLRDLRWLLNAKATLADGEAEEFPAVASSVLNYGTRDFCGVCASSVNVGEVERELVEAIQNFEPRIIRRTLTVKAVPPPEKSGLHTVAFEIRAEVWATPFPEQVFIRTELDLETGQYELK